MAHKLEYTRDEINSITWPTSLWWEQFLKFISEENFYKKTEKQELEEVILDIPDLNLIKKYFKSNENSLKYLNYLIKNNIKFKFTWWLNDKRDLSLIEEDLKKLWLTNFELIIDERLNKDEYNNLAFYKDFDKCYLWYNPSLLVKKVGWIISWKKIELEALEWFYIMVWVKKDILWAIMAKKLDRNIETMDI